MLSIQVCVGFTYMRNLHPRIQRSESYNCVIKTFDMFLLSFQRKYDRLRYQVNTTLLETVVIVDVFRSTCC